MNSVSIPASLPGKQTLVSVLQLPALVLLLILPAGLQAQTRNDDSLVGWTAPVSDPNQPAEGWVDTGHAYVTGGAQALTQWMDDFFGDPTYDLEDAESRLRLQFIDDWESEDGHDLKVRLRGKVQLPRISRRLDLTFSGEDSDETELDDDRVNDEVGLQYRVREGGKSRFDATMSISAGHLRPGVRYRFESSLTDALSQRFIQRLQYADDEKFFGTTQYDLNLKIDRNNVLRWSNRGIYGEKSEGVEWRSRVTLRQRIKPESERPIALAYFAAVNGVTRDRDINGVAQNRDFVKNYRVGVTMRRQVYRDYLFMELEPSYNYRRELYEVSRRGVWGIVLRLEFALRRDLARKLDRD